MRYLTIFIITAIAIHAQVTTDNENKEKLMNYPVFGYELFTDEKPQTCYRALNSYDVWLDEYMQNLLNNCSRDLILKRMKKEK